MESTSSCSPIESRRRTIQHLPRFAAQLAEMAIELDRTPRWPAEQLRLCGEYGVYEWFLDPLGADRVGTRSRSFAVILR